MSAPIVLLVVGKNWARKSRGKLGPRWPLQTPPPVAGSNSPRRTGRSVLLTCFRFARKFLRSFLQSIAFAFEFQLVVAMHEGVQDGSGHDVVAEVGGPVLDDAV